jgi:prolyl-tRNA synthetase
VIAKLISSVCKQTLAGIHELRVFEDADFAKFPALVKGYIGPQDAKKSGITVYADPRIAPGSSWVTGANQKDRHARNVVNGRDFTPDAYVEAAEVRAGDACPECATPVVIDRAIEIGHIFQLGRKYAEALEFDGVGSQWKVANRHHGFIRNWCNPCSCCDCRANT